MTDLVLNVRQIMEYPLKGEASEADAVLLQTGALGGPYAWTTTYGLVTGSLDWAGASLAVGVVKPVDTGPAQIYTGHSIYPLWSGIFWNLFLDDDGETRYWSNGPGALLALRGDNGALQFDAVPPGVAGEESPSGVAAMLVSPLGYMTLNTTLLVARDPEIDFEVATKHYVDEELEDAVEDLNRRINTIYNELIGLYNNNTVWSFNGRTGNILLDVGDIVSSGGAPIDSPTFTGTPTSTTPAVDSNSDRVATTAFVSTAINNLSDYILNHALVTSFNGRYDDVVLLFEDVADLGFAPLYSPSFNGAPTAPTPPSSNSTDRLATTAFVHTNLDLLYTRVSADIADLERDLGTDISRIVRVQDEPPHSPREGDLWWDSSKGRNGGNLFIWYNDPSSSQWVVANSGPPGPPGPPGRAVVDDERPEDGREGEFWFDARREVLHIRVEDRWVEINEER